MAKILCRTKENANPKGKPRVYFTCHPEDFNKHFDKICEDIFKTHDCAIFYTEDMNAVIAEQDKTTDLESNNLFIVPVTFCLLSQPNRAMDADIPFAFEKHIPVLPFMMEPGIDEFYGKKFGELQYLNPYSTDLTEISYEEKLKKYLESVLISDEMAKRIRDAFDAYIFLSYRKKDRRYANELMRLIHSHPKCRDIAIWFDEFLIPGESFKTNIEKALQNSKLFTLLVTPSLLEEPDGKPNFVMGEEYPAARELGIDMLPAEMEKTDKATLAEKYPGIPDCIDPHEEAFKARLLESVSRIAITANDDDSMHNFLIGLAYLEGIDVEVDRQRGLELITTAAEADLPEAMEKLYNMYNKGDYVRLDYRKAAKWAERLAECCKKQHGEEHPDTLLWLHNLAVMYLYSNDYQKALELNEKVYTLSCLVFGEEHPDTLGSLLNLSCTYERLGDCQKALELMEKLYALRCKVLGEDHPDTITTLTVLSMTYEELGDYQMALMLQERAYALRCKVLGEKDPNTLSALDQLIFIYGRAGEEQKAMELYQKLSDIRQEEHIIIDLPDPIAFLEKKARTYCEQQDYANEIEHRECLCELLAERYGEDHQDTLDAMSTLSIAYSNAGETQKALKLAEKVYTLGCKVLGAEHPDTISALNNLAYSYGATGDPQKELELREQVYALRRKIFGDGHPDTVTALEKLRKAQRKMAEMYKQQKACQHCGGPFVGLFKKKCSKCGKPKDY